MPKLMPSSRLNDEPTSESGRVQWHTPSRSKPSQAKLSKNDNVSDKDDLTSVWYNDDDCIETTSNSSLFKKKLNSTKNNRPSSDLILCKTICVFVEQHLKDLKELQRLIDEVRGSANSDASMFYDQEFIDSGFMSRHEFSKLCIRDEQTKAIETIKQLTNYLRELTRIKRLFESKVADNFQTTSSEEDDQLMNMISEKRMDVIQALNDFVLSNSDIDVPIFNDEELINYQEYDLCTDLEKSFSVNRVGDKAGEHGSKTYVFREQTDQLLVEVDDGFQDVSEELVKEHGLLESTNPEQVAMLERRKKEMKKICKDTDELRRLFSDFYNLIKVQGEQLDSIESNIVITNENLKEGRENLSKARRSLTIIMPMTGCLTGALVGGPLGLVIGSKVGGITIVCVTSLLGLVSTYGAHRCFISNKEKAK